MTDPNKEPQIDDMLESLLADYTSVVPRPGLETRILASLQDTAARRSPWSWNFRGLWAGASAAAVVAVLLFFATHRHVGPRQKKSVYKPTAPATSVANMQEHPPAVISHPRLHLRLPVRSFATAANLPPSHRPGVFPTPAPLSAQEKLMLHYLSGTAREEVIAQSHPEDAPQTSVETQDQTEVLPDLAHIPQIPGNTR